MVQRIALSCELLSQMAENLNIGVCFLGLFFFFFGDPSGVPDKEV